MSSIDAVIFDLDGTLVETEQLWEQARKQYTVENGGVWSDRAQRDMIGMNSAEWGRYMHDRLHVPKPPEQIVDEAVQRVVALIRSHDVYLPGAIQTVRALAARWPLGLATAAAHPVIDAVLEIGGIRDAFRVIIGAEEVPRGKPAPDVYLEAARLLRVSSQKCVGIEDSENGIRSGAAAGLRVIAVPNHAFPPSPQALALAAAVVPTIRNVTVERVEALADVPVGGTSGSM